MTSPMAKFICYAGSALFCGVCFGLAAFVGRLLYGHIVAPPSDPMAALCSGAIVGLIVAILDLFFLTLFAAGDSEGPE